MPDVAATLPARRPELLVRPLGEDGRFVVKDPLTGEFFQIGEAERFLLERLDGRHDADAVRAAFEEKFGEPLSEDDLQGFLDTAEEQGFLQPTAGEEPADAPRTPAGRQSILHWRKSLWDPDRLFTRLAPKLWFFWTRTFLVLSAGCVLLAALLVWANRQELASSIRGALKWQTVAVGWAALFVVTLLHECAHGLTCKRHGGEVHEIGFLLLFLMPCFYCNVSDAWLFRERSKRLWVTFAGGYFELFLWALAVFAWRLTATDTLVNYLAFVVLTVCGVQVLFNFNPLLKLDGYYLLSDWLEVPNLHQRGHDQFKGHVRRLLWGALAPPPEPRDGLLGGYGAASWVFSLAFLVLVLGAAVEYVRGPWGLAGLAAVAGLGLLVLSGLFRGLCGGEVRAMILKRRKRAVVWLAILGALAGALFVPVEDRPGGPFQVRSAVRAELRAPVAGFVAEVDFDEGDRVSPGSVVVRLEVPDLAGRVAQKRAEVGQSEARLAALAEETEEQRRRVGRAERWHELAKEDLGRAGRALAEELVRLDRQIDHSRAEADAARVGLDRARASLARGVAAEEQVQEAERRHRAAEAQLAQARAERRACEARGTVAAKLESDHRERDLAEARAALAVLEAGARAREVEAERARLDGLREEERYLSGLQTKLAVRSPVAGLVTTPRLREKVGQYVREGDPICVVEEPALLEVEVTLAEQDAARVRPGQAVTLRARALPLETLQPRVDRVAPAAGRGDAQSTVAVYCRLDGGPPGLRPGMTGYGRVDTGPRPLGGILLDRAFRWLRPECWW
jgi:putative peptide zinc metalloprotease protein